MIEPIIGGSAADDEDLHAVQTAIEKELANKPRPVAEIPRVTTVVRSEFGVLARIFFGLVGATLFGSMAACFAVLGERHWAVFVMIVPGIVGFLLLISALSPNAKNLPPDTYRDWERFN